MPSASHNTSANVQVEQLELESLLAGAKVIDDMGRAGPSTLSTGNTGLVGLLVAVLVAVIGAAWMLVQTSS